MKKRINNKNNKIIIKNKRKKESNEEEAVCGDKIENRYLLFFCSA